MRPFRFRLDPVIRLKKYEIENKEQEIAAIEQEIQRLLREIDEGRQHVLDMRKRLMDEVSDPDFIREEQSLDLFQQYMQRVEAEKRREIQAYQEQKQQKRNELLQLYREDKILERYKEKKQNEWRQESNRQENLQMDEMGIQSFLRNEKNMGGVLLYLIVPMILLAGGAALGIYTGMIKKEMLSNVPILRDYLRSVTDAPVILSATPEDITLTFNDIFGADPDMTIAQGLQNIQDRIEDLNTLQQNLREKEQQLNAREELLNSQLRVLNDQIAYASQQIEVRRSIEQQILDRRQSELSENEVVVSDMLKKMDPKLGAGLLADLYLKPDEETIAPPPVDPNAPVDRELSDNQKKVLRILHRLEQKQWTTLFDAMTKNNLTKQIAPQILEDFLSTNMDELLDVKTLPPPEPIFPEEIDSVTDTLPPPVQRTTQEQNAPAG